MRGVERNYEVNHGDDWSVTLEARDSAGDAVDLSDYTFTGGVLSYTDKTTETTITVDASDKVNGNINFSLTIAQINALAVGRHYYRLKYATSLIEGRTLLEGVFQIYQ